MIRVEHLYKSFNDQKVLEDINLDIKDGELVVILGGSGTGKSVLIKHMIGILKPDKGKVFVGDVDITRLEEYQLLGLRKAMGYMFQEGALYDFMNVLDNIGFPLKEHTTLTSSEIHAKVRATLEMLDLKEVEDKFPAELSGGMKKRVAIARAIIFDPKILFCDEPTSGLDPIRSRDISDLIRNVSKEIGCTTVITSHDIDNSFRIADRLALIQDCRLVAVGSPQELKNSKNTFVKEFVS